MNLSSVPYVVVSVTETSITVKKDSKASREGERTYSAEELDDHTRLRLERKKINEGDKVVLTHGQARISIEPRNTLSITRTRGRGFG